MSTYLPISCDSYYNLRGHTCARNMTCTPEHQRQQMIKMILKAVTVIRKPFYITSCEVSNILRGRDLRVNLSANWILLWFHIDCVVKSFVPILYSLPAPRLFRLSPHSLLSRHGEPTNSLLNWILSKPRLIKSKYLRFPCTAIVVINSNISSHSRAQLKTTISYWKIMLKFDSSVWS